MGDNKNDADQQIEIWKVKRVSAGACSPLSPAPLRWLLLTARERRFTPYKCS